MNNLKPVIILRPGGRRRPGLHADFPVPVLLIPAGGPGGLPYLLKEKESGEDEKKKEDKDEKEEEG